MKVSGAIVIREGDPELAGDAVRRRFADGLAAGEIWIERPDGRVCALMASNRGWMLWLPQGNERGLSTRDPDFAGPTGAVMDFELGNGQVDQYPIAWTLPLAEIARALEQFARSGSMPSHIVWAQ